ncbi:MAG: hypothetical protein AAF581_03135 [Planctomycetota bacterium]
MDLDAIANGLATFDQECSELQIGSHRVVRYTLSVPAFTFESVLMPLRSGTVVQLIARDSFDGRLAEFLLDQCAGLAEAPDSTTLTVHTSKFPTPWQFDTVVVAPPSAANRFEHQSESLNRVTYWCIPAFTGEFAHGDNPDQFRHQVGRKDGWRLPVTRWDRSPKTERSYD